MNRISMTIPLAELDGDEMTRVLWKWIKDDLILPYVDLKTEYYDLGLQNRENTKDEITRDAARAIARLGVGVKCATITPNAQRVSEYQLSNMWKSPNGTLRAMLDGTVFRVPILCRNIKPLVPGWKKPITIARHAYGDVYSAVETAVPKGKNAFIILEDESGAETHRLKVHSFSSCGILQSMHNTDDSIRGFARSCFRFALSEKQDLWFSTKDTISKIYDHSFKDIFQEIYDAEFKSSFEKAGITYFYTLIDDAVARVMRSEGGFIWACKNYDGDVMSDMLATAFGSLGLMRSVLASPSGAFEYEAAHGTVTRHYHRHLAGEETSTNPVATIFAWTGALGKRADIDGNKTLCNFAARLEKATIDTIESGVMTGDLFALASGNDLRRVTTREFIREIAVKLS